MGLVSEQSIYHLDNRTIELEVIPACRHYGLGLIPWSPLAGGLLGGALGKLESGRRVSEGVQKQIEAKRPQLERYEALCRELGEEPGHRGAGLAAAQPGRDGADHRAAHDRAARERGARHRDHARRGDPGQARRDLPRPRRRGAEGVRLGLAPITIETSVSGKSSFNSSISITMS
jgi:hypothetical protein